MGSRKIGQHDFQVSQAQSAEQAGSDFEKLRAPTVGAVPFSLAF